MGRKVHPYGFRLGVIRDWKARWFAEGEEYADLLHEDIMIRQYVNEEVGHAGISTVEIERFPNQVSVLVHTAKPGVVIGRRGAVVKDLRKGLESLTAKRVSVDVQEIDRAEMDAKLVAENVVSQLERRISHSRAMNRAIQGVLRSGAQGVKIVCKGRLYGAEMARQAWEREGRVPLQTLRADIDYAQDEAHTTYGRIGVKVWIYKGEIFPDAEMSEEPSTL
ncbi:MAG TPA: 30S ribosomal protein S3 [Chloroflexi bacterium]|nr:30S ribosomal protein S3 [Chloroflexota bacterium]